MGAALCLHVFYSNVVIAYIDADQLILNFIDYNPKATDPTNPADTRPEVATQAEMLAAPRVARMVTTFTVAAALNDFLTRMMPGVRKARAAPAGTQNHSSVLLPPGAALKAQEGP